VTYDEVYRQRRWIEKSLDVLKGTREHKQEENECM
jgi:hypothetical protein